MSVSVFNYARNGQGRSLGVQTPAIWNKPTEQKS